MPTSATGISPSDPGAPPGAAGICAGRRPARLAGFTLLEILVVVLIIGIVSAGMLLSMNFAGKDTELQNESQRLLSLMKYARSQAELQTRDYGIVFGQHGYEFVVYGVRRNAWRRVFEDDVLRERTLPRGLQFSLVVDARPIVLHEKINVPADADAANSKAHSPADAASASSFDSSPDAGASASGASFAPQVMIFSSGDLSSFKITLERPAAGRSITLDENQDGDIIAEPLVEPRS